MSQNIGTLISAPIRPNDSLDPIASAFSNELLGGLHTVTASTDRDAIILARRNWGMMCYVINDDTTYQLTYGYIDFVITNNLNWKVFTGGSGGSNTSEWLDSAISGTYTAPPGTYSVGSRYLILGVGSGLWTGSDEKIAEYKNTPTLGWYYTTPGDNATIRLDSEDNTIYRYEGIHPSGQWYKDKVNQVLSFTTTLSGASYSATTYPYLNSYSTDATYLAKIDIDNSGTASLNLNGLGNVYIKKDSGTGSLVDLSSGDLKSGLIYPLYYDGTFFQKSSSQTIGGAGLTGSGVISVGAGTGITVSDDAVAVDFSVAADILAGDGLISLGGTISVGDGAGITISSNSVSLDLNTLSGLTFSATGSSGKLQVSVDGSTILVNASGQLVGLASAQSLQNQWYIEPYETITVATNSQYLIYGNLIVDGTVSNYGQVVILNGALDLTGGGTFLNFGTLLIETLQVGGINKYSATFSSTANIGFTISHGLNTDDIIISIKEGLNMINADINIINSNSITVTTNQNVTGRINIIG